MKPLVLKNVDNELIARYGFDYTSCIVSEWRPTGLYAVERSTNLMMLYQSYTQVQQKLLHVLLGLNRVYYFGFKWLDLVAERLRYKPDDLVRRFTQVYQVEPAVGAHELTALVEETYDLVEQHFPDIDIARLRAIFRYRRPVWDQAPPLTR